MKHSSELQFQPRVDQITFEILRHRLWQINDEQGRTIVNVSGSPVAAEANDFNVGIADAQGSIVFVGVYMVPLLSSLSLAAKNALDLYVGEGISEGDAYLTNDPWVGAIHQNDTCVIAPVHWESKLIAWVGSAIHEFDVGGGEPGSWNAEATSAFQEAPLYQFLKVVRGGRTQPEVVATYLRNSRLPQLLELDLRAQIASTNVAKNRLFAVIKQYGVDTVVNVMHDCLDYSDILLRRKLLEIPDGDWYAEDHLDHDGHQEKLYTVRLKLTKKGDNLTFDYRDTDPQTPGFVNCTWPALLSSVFNAVAIYLCNDIPWNAGVLRSSEILCNEGALINAKFPAPVGAGPVNAAYKARNTACLALAKMLSCSEKHKEDLMATWVGASLVHNMSGLNQYGEPFGTMMLSSTLGGGGARYFADGHNNSGGLGSPRPSVINVESAEAAFPLLYIYRKRAIDSGGPGKFRGGVSAESCITPYDVDSFTVNLSTQGTTYSSAIGIDGGYPGAGSNCLLKNKTDIWQRLKSGKFPEGIYDISGELILLPSKYKFEFRTGDVLNTVAHGGGGFGDSLEREPMLVQHDVAEGYVSLEWASKAYGVVLEPKSLKVIADLTEARRKEVEKERLKVAVQPDAALQSFAHETRIVKTEIVLRLGENLHIYGGAVHCRKCEGIICKAGDNPKLYCPVIRSPLNKANPWIALRLGGDNPQFVLLEYVCPSCGRLLFVDQRLARESIHWHDYRIVVGDAGKHTAVAK